MKAIVFEGKKNFVVKDLPKPKPGKGEILVKPHYAGICDTDNLGYMVGVNGSLLTQGVVPGHEFGGEVAEIGPGVEGWEIGDRLSVDPRSYCGQCIMCRAGLYTLCPNGSGWIGISSMRSEGELYHGGMCEYTALPAYSCFKIPSSTTQKGAALIESMACAFRSVRHSGLTLEDNVVIFGACDYSNSALLYSKLAGAGQVVVVDPSKKRRDVAKKLGADAVFNPTKQDVVKSIYELMPFGADVVFLSWNPFIEVSLTYNALASKVARVQGTLMWLKGQGENGCKDVTFNDTAIKELTIKTTASFFSEEPLRGGRARGDFQGVLDSLAKKRVNPDPIVTKIIPFKEVNTKADLDAIFDGYFDELKIQFKIWGK